MELSERRHFLLVVVPRLPMVSAGKDLAASAGAGYPMDVAVVGSSGADLHGELHAIGFSIEIHIADLGEEAFELPVRSGELFEQLLPVEIGLGDPSGHSIGELESVFNPML